MFKVSSTTEERQQEPQMYLNAHIAEIVARASTSDVTAVDSNSNTELDSHANMVVLGRHAFILNLSGKTAQVSPFTPEYDSMKEVPIVDAAVAYDCPITLKSYVLVFHNALSVSSMDHNLVPPFILREAGLEVHDIPKIQMK